MALILRVGPSRGEWWRDNMQSLLPELKVYLWDQVNDPAEIEYAAVWRPPPGGLRRFPNLRGVFSIGAGVDHVLSDSEYPATVPLFRTTGEELTQRMREYVALHVLRFHRRLPELILQQAASLWRQPITPPAPQRTVGVMGLGTLGATAAQTLVALGFAVRGWSRSPRSIAGVEVFAGSEQFEAFLGECEILVCMLPLTTATQSLLNRQTFAALPPGACVINVGRGEHLVEDDLIEALDSGHIAAATLDVFQQEPLPSEHPFWSHPKVTVTPHVASLIDPLSGGKLLAANIRRLMAGDPLDDLRVDPEQGY